MRAVAAALARMAAVAEVGTAVELHLLDDAQLATLNARHLNAWGCTNVLSFPGERGNIGALFLSLDTFARECLLHDQEPAIHLMHLLAHGTAHLLGLDHGPAMEEMENRCLESALDYLNLDYLDTE